MRTPCLPSSCPARFCTHHFPCSVEVMCLGGQHAKLTLGGFGQIIVDQLIKGLSKVWDLLIKEFRVRSNHFFNKFGWIPVFLGFIFLTTGFLSLLGKFSPLKNIFVFIMCTFHNFRGFSFCGKACVSIEDLNFYILLRVVSTTTLVLKSKNHECKRM